MFCISWQHVVVGVESLTATSESHKILNMVERDERAGNSPVFSRFLGRVSAVMDIFRFCPREVCALSGSINLDGERLGRVMVSA